MMLIMAVNIIIVCVVLAQKYLTHKSNFPPGPLSFPIIGSILSLGNQPLKKLSQMKNKYGNLVAINFGSRRAVVLNDSEAIKQVFSLKEVQDRPDVEIFKIIRGGQNVSGIALSSGKTNEEQRAFTMKTIKRFDMGKKSSEFILVEEIQRLFKTIDEHTGTPVLNQDLFQVAVMSALWRTMTGDHSIEESKDPEFMDMMRYTRTVGKNLNVFTLYLPTLAKWFPKLSGWNQLTDSNRDLMNYVGKMAESQGKVFSADIEPRNFIEAYLQKINNTHDINSSFFGKSGHDNLKGTLNDLLAATDNIALTLMWFLTVACYYPEIQDKIICELDSVIERDRFPSLEDRQRLPYLESFVLEIFRFSALAPLGIPRAFSEDVVFEGYLFPKGTIVIPNVYDALHNPKRWHEPEIFKPERFLNEDGSAIDRTAARDVDLLFGHGKRICPGKNFAKDEIFLFIAGLCQRYTFERDPNWKYGEKIETELGIVLLPIPHTLIINKR